MDQHERTNTNAQHGSVMDRAVLFSRLRSPFSVLLETSRPDAQNSRSLLFHSPHTILSAASPEELPSLFAKMETVRAEGRWLAGFFSYEAGTTFDGIDPWPDRSSPLPLAWLGVYDVPEDIPRSLLRSVSVPPVAIPSTPVFSPDRPSYTQRIERIQRYIADGDTYQVNFTGRFDLPFTGDPVEWYFDLRRRQHVPYGALLDLGDAQILSFSPELFFRIHNGTIITKPMKGTSRRGRTTEEDAILSETLLRSEKERSENLMIVDLLRNDLGRICEPGSVEVPRMYDIERYDTVLQMTSTVSGKVRTGVTMEELFRALFPCGSVTGAPKIRTMQIIRELESGPRGIYCGSIGYIAPHDEMAFNVAIRTVTVHSGRASMGVGSGIVHDSDAQKEYEECQVKARFLLDATPVFQLIETMLWDNEFVLLERHLRRLKDSAEYFSFRYDRETVLRTLNEITPQLSGGTQIRVRLLLSSDGSVTVTTGELTAPTSAPTVRIAPVQTDGQDRFLFHKTTHRELYDEYRSQAVQENIADYLFTNTNGELTEGTITNLFIEVNGRFFTPPLSCGVLPGVFRAEILANDGRATERILTIDDLRSADAIYLCNSLRGWRKVTLSPP